MPEFFHNYEACLPALLPQVPTQLLGARLIRVRDLVRKNYGVENHHQDMSSIITLWLMAAWFKPEVIVEVGTSHGLSLSTWVIYNQAEIHAVDLSLQPFYRIQAWDPLPVRNLTLHQGCVSTMDFPRMIRDRRVLFFYDIHDLEDRSFFQEVAVPKIFPYLSGIPHVFLIHDIVLVEKDYQSPDPRHDGLHKSFDGRFWVGFKEVKHLVEWSNQNQVNLYRPSELLEKLATNPVELTSIVALQVPPIE